MNTIKHKLNLCIPVALLFTLNIYLFAPAAVYEKNMQEFSFGLLELLSFYILPFAVTIVVFIVLAIIIPKNKIHYYVSLLLALAVLFWVQGTFVSWDYGVFNGILIDWEKYKWHGIVDLLVWSAVIAAALIFARRVSRVANLVSVGLIVVQGIFLVVVGFSHAENFWLEKYDRVMKFPESLAHYSNDLNVVHIVLDHFQTDVFLEIIKEESLFDKFDGFTLYKENMTNVPLTSFSIPAMFSGEIYDGKVVQSEYYQECLAEKGFHNYLHENGYIVNLVPVMPFPEGGYDNHYTVPHVYGGTIKDEKFQKASHLFEIALFRYSPQIIKRCIYNKDRWLVSRILSKPPGNTQVSHVAFFKDYIHSIMKKEDRPAYHFLHLNPPHPPYVFDRHGNYDEGLDQSDRENYKNQAAYMVSLLLDFFDKLKREGLYDDAFIIVCGDHGAEFQPIFDGVPVTMKHGRVPALLAVKTPGSKGPMKVSDAQTALSDIPATIMDVLLLDKTYEGVSIRSEDELKDRRRKFIIPLRGESVQQYIVTGSIYRAGRVNLDRCISGKTAL